MNEKMSMPSKTHKETDMLLYSIKVIANAHGKRRLGVMGK